MTSALDITVSSMGLAPLSLSQQSSMLGTPRHLGSIKLQQQSPTDGRSSRSLSPTSPSPPRHRSSSSSVADQLKQQQQQQASLGQRVIHHHQVGFGLASGPPLLQPSTPSRHQLNMVGGHGGSSSSAPASPPPASSNPENNTCRLVDYRGARVAAFNVDGRQLICLPQAFDLFLKHLVGGLHTVYTKLKRLDVTPVVCNVEQVRVLRGLGAIQPGVNRCKLISPSEFDILYDDCTNSSARPGRPPKRSLLGATPEGLQDTLKRSRGMIEQIISSSDYFTTQNVKHHLLDGSGAPMHYHHQQHQHHASSLGLVGPAGSASHRNSMLAAAFHAGGGGSSPSAGLMSLAAELQRSSVSASSVSAAINSSASGLQLGPLHQSLNHPTSVGARPSMVTGPAPGSTPANTFAYPPAHLAAAAAAAAAAGHFAFLPLAAAAAHPGMMNLATMAAAAGHLHNMRAAANGGLDHVMSSMHGASSTTSGGSGGGGGLSARHLDATTTTRSSRGSSSHMSSSTPQASRSDEYNNNAITYGSGSSGKNYANDVTGSGADRHGDDGGNDDVIDRRAPSVDRPLNLEMHGRRSTGLPVAVERRSMAGSDSRNNVDDRESVSSGDHASLGGDVTRPNRFEQSKSSAHDGATVGQSVHVHYENTDERHRVISGANYEEEEEERNSAASDADDEDIPQSIDCYPDCTVMCNGLSPLVLNGVAPGNLISDLIGRTASNQNSTCDDGVLSLDTLFANIQGLIKMAVERSHQREQQIVYEKADFKMKMTKERQLRDKLSKQLAAEQRAIDALQRRLRRERKTRRDLELQMREHQKTQQTQQQTSAATPGCSDASSRFYGYHQCHSPGGSTDNDEGDSQQQARHQVVERSTDHTRRANDHRRPGSIETDSSSNSARSDCSNEVDVHRTSASANHGGLIDACFLRATKQTAAAGASTSSGLIAGGGGATVACQPLLGHTETA